mgnify:FL=1
MTKTVAFDPGYAKNISSFINNIEYIYAEINKFKNLGQKKFKFKTYYPQILALIEQNIAFYLGCLLWATYVSSQKGCKLTGNNCLGLEYNEDIELEEVNYIIEFIKHFNKDTKYYLNIPFEIESYKMNILETYKDFARLNKGFVDSKTSDDIKLPNQLKTPDENGIQTIFDTITKDVVPNGDFEKLYTLTDYIL